GHVHPFGMPGPDRSIDGVPVLNTVGYTYFEIAPGSPGAYRVRERRRGA
ncbi:metallophosphoesterase, partial [Tsukamurella pulmonis]